jgi:hypothetical protein
VEVHDCVFEKRPNFSYSHRIASIAQLIESFDDNISFRLGDYNMFGGLNPGSINQGNSARSTNNTKRDVRLTADQESSSSKPHCSKGMTGTSRGDNPSTGDSGVIKFKDDVFEDRAIAWSLTRVYQDLRKEKPDLARRLMLKCRGKEATFSENELSELKHLGLLNNDNNVNRSAQNIICALSMVIRNL